MRLQDSNGVRAGVASSPESSTGNGNEEAEERDPAAVSEIVQFMRMMASDPGRQKMADMAGDIAVKFCHTLDMVKGPGTAKKVLARACPSGKHVFAYLKYLANSALVLGPIPTPSSNGEIDSNANDRSNSSTSQATETGDHSTVDNSSMLQAPQQQSQGGGGGGGDGGGGGGGGSGGGGGAAAFSA